MKTSVHAKTCAQISIALFKKLKERNSPNVHQLMDIQNVIYSYDGILFGPKKERRTDKIWLNLESIMLNLKSQSQKNIYNMDPFI